MIAAAATALDTCLAAVPTSAAPDAESLGALWREVVALLDQTVPASRSVLLGARDPNLHSCVAENPPFTLAMDPHGGPGTRMAALMGASDRQRRSPLADLRWHQTTLRSFDETLRTENQKVYARAVRLADETARLARGLAQATAWPAGLRAVGVQVADHRLARAAWRLDHAIAGRRLPETRRASGELASATFALADLHRWLDLLASNHLAQLHFQAQCRHVYARYEDAFGDAYRSDPNLCRFPAGRGWVTANRNLMEVEHQAEWLFRSPPAEQRPDATNLSAGADAVSQVPAAVWMPPALRSTFVRLREGLRPDARDAWDQAARAPFHHSYLANMLFHVNRHDGVEFLVPVLERFQAANPRVTVSDLMDVIFYRGGDPDGGQVWDDRFQPRLMAAAGILAGTDRQVLLGAQHFTRAVFGSWDRYGKAPTLRHALGEGHFDCIGATDMIGALYRNAGRAGFYNVHLAGGGGARVVAGAPGVVLYHRDALYLLDRFGVPLLGVLEPVPGVPPTGRHDRGRRWPRRGAPVGCPLAGRVLPRTRRLARRVHRPQASLLHGGTVRSRHRQLPLA